MTKYGRGGNDNGRSDCQREQKNLNLWRRAKWILELGICRHDVVSSGGISRSEEATLGFTRVGSGGEAAPGPLTL